MGMELEHAEIAHRNGNEGRARVCARRAAGIVIGEFLRRNELPDPDPSALDRLRSLAAKEDVSEEIRTSAAHFLMKITPENKLPIEVDLIAEVYWLAEILLGYPPDSSTQ